MALGSLPTVAVIANFTVATGSPILHFNDATNGKFNTGLFGGGSNDGADIINYVRSGTISRGVSRFDGVYARSEAGRASVLLTNLDRRFDPTNLSGPYVSAGVTQVTPMRAFWIVATWSGVTYALWRGYADSWDLEYPASGNDATALLSGTDGTKVLANFDGLEQSTQGTGERTDQRLTRVLDNAGFPAVGRTFDQGKTTCQATTLASNAWTEALLTTDTEIGELYFEGDGAITFRDRHALLEDTRSTTSQATFGDAGSELRYESVELAHDDTQIYNTIHISRTGGTTKTAQDTASQTAYLKRTFTRTDLVHQTDAISQDYADFVLALHRDGELRFESITVRPQRSPTTLWPQVLGRRFGDRITVKLTPPGGGSRISRDVFIRGVEHSWGGGEWTTRWGLQDASRFGGFVLDSASNGVLGTSWLAF